MGQIFFYLKAGRFLQFPSLERNKDIFSRKWIESNLGSPPIYSPKPSLFANSNFRSSISCWLCHDDNIVYFFHYLCFGSFFTKNSWVSAFFSQQNFKVRTAQEWIKSTTTLIKLTETKIKFFLTFNLKMFAKWNVRSSTSC